MIEKLEWLGPRNAEPKRRQLCVQVDYRRIPRISPRAYLFHKDISVGLYADTKVVLLKSNKEVGSTLLKITVQTKTTDDCVEMYKKTYMVRSRPMGLCDEASRCSNLAWVYTRVGFC